MPGAQYTTLVSEYKRKVADPSNSRFGNSAEAASCTINNLQVSLPKRIIRKPGNSSKPGIAEPIPDTRQVTGNKEFIARPVQTKDSQL
jgi:hypothetical protein